MIPESSGGQHLMRRCLKIKRCCYVVASIGVLSGKRSSKGSKRERQAAGGHCCGKWAGPDTRDKIRLGKA